MYNIVLYNMVQYYVVVIVVGFQEESYYSL